MTKTITVRGQEWIYSFLSVVGTITTETERDALAQTAVTMQLDSKKYSRFKGEGYEGAIQRPNKNYHFVAPGFSGTRFDATIDSTRGNSKLSVLVTMPTNSALN